MVWLALVVIGSIVWSVAAWLGRNSRPRVVARALEQVWQRLRSEHGAKDFYSGSEVAAALTTTRVTDDIAPFAYARYCREADFLASPACSGRVYRELRDEMLSASRPNHQFPHRRKPNI